MCPEYYRYYDGDMSQDGCDQSEQASVSAWLGFLVMGSNATESIDNGRFFKNDFKSNSAVIYYPQISSRDYARFHFTLSLEEGFYKLMRTHRQLDSSYIIENALHPLVR